MNITADRIERLVFVKYLLKQAEHSKELNRPLSSTTVLTLHDAVECYLQLAYEVFTGKAKLTGQNILDTYSEKINEILDARSKPLINKAFIKRVNELRNQLKHATIFIDGKNIQNLYSETALFFTDFSPLIFGLDFDQISLISLISHDQVRTQLLDAEAKIKDQGYQSAIFAIGRAFYELEHMATDLKGKYGENLLSKYRDVDYLFKYKQAIFGEEPNGMLRGHLEEIAEDVNRIQVEIHQLKKIILLGADLKEFIRYEQLIPKVTKITKGDTGKTEFWCYEEENNIKVDYTFDQVKFCFDFVVDLSISKSNI